MTTNAPERPQSPQRPTQLVIGAGEVGTALARVLGCDLRDIEPHPDLKPHYDVLHIAYGWHDDFENTTWAYISQYLPSLVVVHSTVKVGVCDRNGWVHSPVRGRHPHMEEGLRTFVKHFGGERAREAEELWTASDVILHERAATTELGKLVELAGFGVEVSMNKEIYRLAQEYGVPFDEVYGEFGFTYNTGYRELGEERFWKPVLHYTEGPIGGHCTGSGIHLLGDPWFLRATAEHIQPASAKGVATS